ncbi:NAD(P)-dependent oxidoreductase [Marinoscillum luteum]|uniref:NAD(P)-dependent oxidoreductase n=1 Tax=Marinoscillum luteum TaxID=861051 RepID=A0ABW7N6Z4_9BACT
MRKIAVFGASGRTGRYLVEEVIAQGYIPVCLVREESTNKPIQTEVVTHLGSPMNYGAVLETIEGCDAVLCALNIARKSDFPWSTVTSPPNLLEESMKNIVNAMKEKGIKRVITVSAWGVGDSYKEVNWMFRFLINKTNVGVAYKGHEDQERILRNSSLNWTAVRPVGLNNDTKHHPTRISQNGSKKLRMMISRQNVAKFMLEILDDEKYYQTNPSISNE